MWLGVLMAAIAAPPPEVPTAPIVGGQPAAEGEWPEAGALFFRDLFACTSVLVASDLLLTAGHCFGSPFSLEKTVVVDTVDHALGGVELAVAEQYQHDEYLETFDVSVFVLAEPAPVKPKPLLLDCLADDWLVEGGEVAIVGFGATDEDAEEGTTQLREARTTIRVPGCDDPSMDCNERVAPDGELVAGGGGVDTCVGDSGGPLYVITPDGPYLAGITSRGVWPTDTTCGGGGIYVRLDAVADWIEDVTGRALARPACEGRNRPPRPVAPPIEVGLGEQAIVTVDPGDPNADDTHTFEVVAPPRVGAARIDGAGQLTYDAPATLPFATELTVRVTDAGGYSGEVVVPVEVEGPRSGCGCQGRSSQAPWSLALILPLVVPWRRRPRIVACCSRSGG